MPETFQNTVKISNKKQIIQTLKNLKNPYQSLKYGYEINMSLFYMFQIDTKLWRLSNKHLNNENTNRYISGFPPINKIASQPITPRRETQ